MIYIGIFILLVLCSILEANFVFDKRNRLFNILIILLILLIGTREGNGADFYRYKGLFDAMSGDMVFKYDDIGFAFSVYILKCMGLESKYIFLFFAIILCLLLRQIILDNSCYRYPALLMFYSLYMFPFGFNAMGQGIATMIMLYSIRPMEQKKECKVLICTLLATAFHRIGILNILFWIIMKSKMKSSARFLLVISGFIGSVALFYLSQSGMLEKILTGDFRKIYISYFEQYEGSVDFVSFFARVFALVIIGIAMKLYNNYEKKIFFIYLLGIMAYIALLSNSLLATRINLSLKMVEILLIGTAIKGIKGISGRSVYIVMLAIFLFSVLLSALGNTELNPYKSWLFFI